MSDNIELHKKTNRDLLVILVTKVNNIENRLECGSSQLRDHEHRLTVIETCQSESCNQDSKFTKFRKNVLYPGGAAGAVIAIYETVRYLFTSQPPTP